MGALRSTEISDAQLDGAIGGCQPCQMALVAVETLAVAKIAFVTSILP